MHAQIHPIATEPGLATCQLTSYRYGASGGQKVVIQAALHADEVPALLVAHFLRRELERLDADGRIHGEVILVPASNPIGVSQVAHGVPFGRFDLGTIELRGEMDVRYDYAERDARAILQFLAHEDVVDLPPPPASLSASLPASLPAPLCAPTPLEAVEPLHAPQSGVLVFLKSLGDDVKAGEAVADIVNPVTGDTASVRARRDGLLFASTAHRHLLRGMQVCKIAGTTAFRSSSLPSQ